MTPKQIVAAAMLKSAVQGTFWEDLKSNTWQDTLWGAAGGAGVGAFAGAGIGAIPGAIAGGISGAASGILRTGIDHGTKWLTGKDFGTHLKGIWDSGSEWVADKWTGQSAAARNNPNATRKTNAELMSGMTATKLPTGAERMAQKQRNENFVGNTLKTPASNPWTPPPSKGPVPPS